MTRIEHRMKELTAVDQRLRESDYEYKETLGQVVSTNDPERLAVDIMFRTCPDGLEWSECEYVDAGNNRPLFCMRCWLKEHEEDINDKA